MLDDVRRGTWLGLDEVDERKFVGVASSPPDETDAVVVRFRERIVTVAGTALGPFLADLGETWSGLVVGPGSLERADCTLASSRCI